MKPMKEIKVDYKIKSDDIRLGMQFYKINSIDDYTLYTVTDIIRDLGLVILYNIETDTETIHKIDWLLNDCYCLSDYIEIPITLLKTNLGGASLYCEKDYDTFVGIGGDGYIYHFIMASYNLETESYLSNILKRIIKHFSISDDIKNDCYDILKYYMNYIFDDINEYKARFESYIPFNTVSIGLFDYSYDAGSKVIDKIIDINEKDDIINIIEDECALSNAIINCEIYLYDQTINLDEIVYDHFIVYSLEDDKFYIILYDKGPALYRVKYYQDEEVSEVVQFMLS